MSFEVFQIDSECGHREQAGFAFEWEWSPFTPYWGHCVGTSGEINYFSQISRDETVKMKGRWRETNFCPVKGQRRGCIGPSLAQCEAAEQMVLVRRGTQAHPTGRVIMLGDQRAFLDSTRSNVPRSVLCYSCFARQPPDFCWGFCFVCLFFCFFFLSLCFCVIVQACFCLWNTEC